MKMFMTIYSMLFIASVLFFFTGCTAKKEQAADVPSTETPSIPEMKARYCITQGFELVKEGEGYNLIADDLTDQVVPMTSFRAPEYFALEGEFDGIGLNLVAPTGADTSTLEFIVTVSKGGEPRLILNLLAREGACPEYDLNQLPKIASNPFDLNDIEKISRYRSSSGHDYTDASETCRSMKHYIYPYDHRPEVVEIKSPFKGRVIGFHNDDEIIGDDGIHNQHIILEPINQQGMEFHFFHTKLVAPLKLGQIVNEGEHLAWADFVRNGGAGSDIDIAIHLQTSAGRRNASYFDLVTDTAFQEFAAWSGLQSRDDFKISKAARDANPLQCTTKGGGIKSMMFVDQDSDNLLNLRWVEHQ